MTKTQKINILIFSLLECLALIGAFLSHLLIHTNTEMLSKVIIINEKWSFLIDIFAIKYVIILIIIATITFIFLHYKKQKAPSKIYRAIFILTLLINVYVIFYLAIFDIGINKAYYIVSLFLCLATLFQNITYFYYSTHVK